MYYTTDPLADVLICVVGWLCFIAIAYYCHMNNAV